MTDDLDGAVALLADALRGALEWELSSGGTEIPRPQLSKIERAAPTMLPLAVVDEVQKPDPVVDAPLPDDVDEAIAAVLASSRTRAEKLAALEEEVLGPCTRCKLNRGRTKIVFGVGNPSADLVFVGEGPGAEEDRQGVPFVGRAGELLTKMIESGMGLKRDEVYICNVVKCRPPNNRDPEPDEVQACERFLKAQLAVLEPKVIVTLGKYAAQALLRTSRPISRLRGNWFDYEGIPLMPTFHPAYLLREESKKRPTWEDLKSVMRRMRE